MKRFQFTLIILITTFYNGLVNAQESDYNISKSFQEKFIGIELALNNSLSVEAIDSLKEQILVLESDYSNHYKLLDNALYPSSYQEEMRSLQLDANTAEQRLLIIENQIERLSSLSDEIINYRSEITFLNDRTDSLRKAIHSSQASEERLAKLVKNYRKNLEVRDELIMGVIDSLLISYQNMNTSKVEEIADGVEKGRISNSNNPLNMIEEILTENIEFTNSNTRPLNVEDHLRMYAVQYHFNEAWDQIGDKLLNAYAGSEKGRWEKSINDKSKEWRMAASQKMWNSMDQYLEFSNVKLEAFDNNYSFFIALDSFVKDAQDQSKNEILTSESYNDYKRFQEFWSTKIKNEWSGIVHETDVLTIAQISSIDEQLSGWENESRPIHPLILVLLILTIVFFLGYMLVIFKTRKA